jgi:tRNA threonylcarbamoyladenosine biosynthesis protein TsaE
MKEILLEGASATEALGAALAGALQPGEAVCLFGPLGAGKTTLARGLIRTLSSDERDVPSPTFTIVQFYEGNGLPLAHFDLYRLERPEEAYEIGLDEALEEGAVLIEWPERLEGRLPPDRLDIVLSHQGEARRARLTPHGAWEGRPLEF